VAKDDKRSTFRDLAKERKPGEPDPVWTELRNQLGAAPAPEPVWIGWVLCAHRDGYRRRKIALPQSVVDEWAAGPELPPDLRSNVVAQMTRDAMGDELLTELHRKDG
jgi:hypothetical protein